MARLGVFVIAMAAFLYAYAKLAAPRMNEMLTSPLDTIEQSHLKIAQQTAQDLQLDLSKGITKPLKLWLPHRTDGLVQPLWPWMAAWGAGSSEDAQGLLLNARGLQFGMAVGFLLLLGLACLRRFTLPATLLVVALSGLCGFLPALGTFDSTVLFMILLMLTWTACIFALKRNSLWIHGLVGCLAGLAYLADERILFLLGVFLLTSTLRALWGWLLSHWPTEHGTTLWVRSNHLFGLLILTFTFLIFIGPRLAESSSRFGSPFFSYISQTRWLDTAEQAAAWIAQHPDSASLQSRPDADRLPWSGYLETHSSAAIKERLTRGLDAVWRDFFYSGGIWTGALVSIVLGLCVAIVITTPKAGHAAQRLHPETANLLLFEVLALSAYVVVAAWDAEVSGSQRALQFLQIPLILNLIWACESLLRRAKRRQASPLLLKGYEVALWALVLVVSWQMTTQLQTGLFGT